MDKVWYVTGMRGKYQPRYTSRYIVAPTAKEAETIAGFGHAHECEPKVQSRWFLNVGDAARWVTRYNPIGVSCTVVKTTKTQVHVTVDASGRTIKCRKKDGREVGSEEGYAASELVAVDDNFLEWEHEYLDEKKHKRHRQSLIKAIANVNMRYLDTSTLESVAKLLGVDVDE